MIGAVTARTAPVLEQGKAWIEGRSARERLLLGVLAVLGLAAVGWYGVIQPLAVARQDAVERIALYESLQARLRAAPSGAVQPASPPLSGPLIDAVRQAASQQSLTIEIAGDEARVTATATGARFDSAAALVDTLERGGINVSSLQLTATGQPGVVDLTLTATRP